MNFGQHVERDPMIDPDVQDALNQGMLDAAQRGAEAGDYAEAFEDILAVLAVDPTFAKANLALVETALLLLASPELANRLVHDGLKTLAGSLTGLNTPDLVVTISRLKELMATAYSAPPPLSAADKKLLLVLSRYARSERPTRLDFDAQQETYHLVFKMGVLVRYIERTWRQSRYAARAPSSADKLRSFLRGGDPLAAAEVAVSEFLARRQHPIDSWEVLLMWCNDLVAREGKSSADAYASRVATELLMTTSTLPPDERGGKSD